MKCLVKTRARDNKNEAVIKIINKNEISVEFKEEVRAVTPGQVAAFYTYENQVLGSGFIQNV